MCTYIWMYIIEEWKHINVPVVGMVEGCMLGSGWLLTSLKFGTEVGAWDSISLDQAKQATGCASGTLDFRWTFSSCSKCFSGAWDSWKSQCANARVIPRGPLHCPARFFFFRVVFNWTTRTVLTDWLWVTQIVYSDRDWHKIFAQFPNALRVALAVDTNLEIVCY